MNKNITIRKNKPLESIYINKKKHNGKKDSS